MLASDHASLAKKYLRRSGAQFVAYGSKEVGGKALDELSVTFFVSEKVPRKGSTRVLENGASLLPSSVVLGGKKYPTDVVALKRKDPFQLHSGASGGLVTMGQVELGPRSSVGTPRSLGSIACLTRSQETGRLHLLTAAHVLDGIGTSAFIPSFHSGRLSGKTTYAVGKVADEVVQPFRDEPDGYFDMDVGLVEVADEAILGPLQKGLNSNDVFRVYDSGSLDMEAYIAAYRGKRLQSYSFLRPQGVEGRISHIFPTTVDSQNRSVTYFFLIESTDGRVPGIPRESGKSWVLKEDPTRIVGMHLGLLRRENKAYGIATEIGAALRLAGVELLK